MDVINIRESLLDIDRKTYCKYDLTTLYEACNLDDQNKKKLVQYIASYEHPSVIGKFLETNAGPMMEAVADDLTDAETTKVIDDINDGTERTLWNLLDKADEEDKKLSEDVNWRTAPNNSKEVSSYVYRKIKMHDDLTSDDSRYWDFDRCVREGDDAKLVKSAPKGAKYSFSLVNGDVDIDLYMGYGASEDGSDCWFVVDNNPDSDVQLEMYEEAEPSYKDRSGILGIPGERYTMSQLDDIWEQGKDSDPSIMAYKGNRNAWFNDTLRHMDECATVNGGESLDEEWSEKDVEFNDKYFPRVDINDRSRYDYVQYKGKHFAYDKKHNIVMYLFQDDEEVENMGAEAPWREMDGVGLSAENWNNKEVRQEYLDEWIFEMDAETSYMIQDFVQNELPYYQKNGVVEESYRDIDTILDDLGGVDSVRSRIADARDAYPGIDDDELVDMLCDGDNSEDWACAIEYLGEGFIGDMAKVGKAAVKAVGKKIADSDFYQGKVKPTVDKAKQKIADTKKKIADSDVGKAARDAYDKTGTKRKMNSARNVRDYKKRIANATTFEEVRAILDDMKVTNSKGLDANHQSTRGFSSPHEVAYLKGLLKKRCREMDIQMPKSLGEAVEPTVLTCRLEVYDRFGGGNIRKLRVRGADVHAALTSLVGKIQVYLTPDQCEGLTAEQILQNLEESNGDGCDYITELKNETTGEVLLAGDAEMDWEEYGIDEAVATAERPMSKMAGTLSSVLLAHKDEVETLFDVRSAIEFLDRIRPEVKNVGYVDKVKSDLMRKRGANPVQYFWNIILKGDGEGTDKGGASSTPRSKIKKWARESLKEEVNSNDDVTLEYWDLEGYSGCFELNIGWDEFVESVQDDVLTDMISDEEFEAHSPDGVTADPEWLDDYIRSNADEIFRKYEKKLLDQFRDIAQERANDEMADDDYPEDPRYEPEYWEESWNWKEGINEEVELDRKNFVSLVKDREGYFVLLDGTYQKEIIADTDEEAIQKFRATLDDGNRVKTEALITEKDWDTKGDAVKGQKESIKQFFDRLFPYPLTTMCKILRDGIQLYVNEKCENSEQAKKFCAETNDKLYGAKDQYRKYNTFEVIDTIARAVRKLESPEAKELSTSIDLIREAANKFAYGVRQSGSIDLLEPAQKWLYETFVGGYVEVVKKYGGVEIDTSKDAEYDFNRREKANTPKDVGDQFGKFIADKVNKEFYIEGSNWKVRLLQAYLRNEGDGQCYVCADVIDIDGYEFGASFRTAEENCVDAQTLIKTCTDEAMEQITRQLKAEYRNIQQRTDVKESVEDEDKAYTHAQVFDELKLETRNFTIDGDTIQYYHQSEANAAVKILKKHYTTVEGPTETTDEWFRIEFSGKKGSKKTESVGDDEVVHLDLSADDEMVDIERRIYNERT